MTMSRIWTGMLTAAVCCALWTGRGAEVARAAMEGAQAGLELCISIGGMLCLWSGVMEVMERCGLAEKLARFMAPALRLIFGEGARDKETREAIAANISANLLGLGNAATPLGLKAISRLARMEKVPGRASDDMCTLVVCNAASLQRIPPTVAAVRLAAGCERPFDILPAVWLCSVTALCVGLGMCAVLRRVWRE